MQTKSVCWCCVQWSTLHLEFKDNVCVGDQWAEKKQFVTMKKYPWAVEAVLFVTQHTYASKVARKYCPSRASYLHVMRAARHPCCTGCIHNELLSSSTPNTFSTHVQKKAQFWPHEHFNSSTRKTVPVLLQNSIVLIIIWSDEKRNFY